MNISLSKCQEILDTLPIGYYLGCKVPVILSPDNNDTFVNMGTREITISYPTIARSLDQLKIKVDPEPIVRGLLYHEISHLLMTCDFSRIQSPKHWFEKKLQKYFPALNIFEDERIESALRTYYMRVDFRKNLQLLNAPATPQEMALDKDPTSRFYAAVRFRVGPAKVLERIQKVLEQYIGMMPMQPSRAGNYLNDIADIYDWFCKHKPLVQDQKKQMNSPLPKQERSNTDQPGDRSTVQAQASTQSDGSGASSDNGKEQSGYPQIVDGGMNATPEEALDNDIQDPIVKGVMKGASLKDIVQSRAKEMLVNPALAAVESRVTKIVQSVLNRRANQSTASTGYAGRLDPRLCGDRHYKWFAKPAANASGKKFAKVKINLFVDNSGSFCGSRDAINALSSVLQSIEDKFPAFTFDFVRIDTRVKLMPKNERYATTNGGSWLQKTIFPVYKQLQQPESLIANIAVFDGRMIGERVQEDSDRTTWAAFNHPNVYIISDSDNEDAISMWCPQAKAKILTGKYEEEFTNTVLNALERLLS